MFFFYTKLSKNAQIVLILFPFISPLLYNTKWVFLRLYPLKSKLHWRYYIYTKTSMGGGIMLPILCIYGILPCLKPAYWYKKCHGGFGDKLAKVWDYRSLLWAFRGIKGYLSLFILKSELNLFWADKSLEHIWKIF